MRSLRYLQNARFCVLMLISVRLCAHLLIRVPLTDAPAPHEAHARLASRYEATFVLESREGPERLARYSFVGFDPVGIASCDRNGLTVSGTLPAPSDDQSPIEYLRRVQAFYHTDDRTSPFVGGLVGSLGYHFGRLAEPILDDGSPEEWPRFLFGLYLDAIVYDHVTGTTHYVSRHDDRSAEVQEALHAPAATGTLRVGPVTAETDASTYRAQVEKAKQLIAQGECFQIVLSRRYHASYTGPLSPLYAALRTQAAVPYLYYLRFPDGRRLLGASPEMLVRIRQGRCETFPIAGTRPLTGNEAADAEAGLALQADPKEKAEHAMLVDLARNDLARVCRPGTVDVASFQELHRFRTVQHLVSRVTGKLESGRDAFDAIGAVFPAGTVSGAPKIRAQQHIQAIERHDRGAYAGAVAYVSFNGDFDSAIAIRSLSANGERVTIQAGAGIVHRSDPASEFEETRHKAATILNALRPFGGTLEEDA